MDPSVEIGPVTGEEFERVLPLLADYQRFYGVEQPDTDRNRAFFQRFLEPSEDGLLLGARDGDEMVGFANLYWTFSSIKAKEVTLLADLLVKPEHRGRGIGRALIDASAEVARSRGSAHLEWLTMIDNRTAQRLYEQVGDVRDALFEYEIELEPPS